jgi:hypothetical protein
MIDKPNEVNMENKNKVINIIDKNVDKIEDPLIGK